MRPIRGEPFPGSSVYIPRCQEAEWQIGRTPLTKENTMDAKYNWLIDNVSVRVTLNTVAFALWMATAIALLEAASKL
jgi:hypothetical protein